MKLEKTKLFFLGFLDGLRRFSHLIAGIVNLILLVVVYFLGVGVVAIISKIFGKHFLGLKNSSWASRKLKTEKMENYYRTF